MGAPSSGVALPGLTAAEMWPRTSPALQAGAQAGEVLMVADPYGENSLFKWWFLSVLFLIQLRQIFTESPHPFEQKTCSVFLNKNNNNNKNKTKQQNPF